MGICKKVTMFFARMAEVLRSRDLIMVGSTVKCFKMKIIRQRDTERAHNPGLHDNWRMGIITRTAESFLGCQMVLLSKSQVR